MAKADEEGDGAELPLSAAIHRVQLALLDDGPFTDRQLFAAGALLSCPDYEDVVVERSIVGVCGYPTCPNPLPADRPRRGRYRISLNEHKVYDLEETYKFCSEACVVGSRAFSGSLQPERCLSVGPGRVAELLRLFEDLSLERSAGPGRGRPKARAAAEDGDFGFSRLTIHEKSEVAAGEVSAEEWIGPSNAIEGFVPQRERNQGADAKRKAKTKPKAKPKPAKGSIDTDATESEFTSTIIVGDHPFNIAPSVLASIGLEQGVPRLKEGAHVEKAGAKVEGEFKEPPALKSSLKTAGATSRNRTVKWADEGKLEAFDGTVRSVDREVSKQMKNSLPLNEEDDDGPLRLASAVACVAGLVLAAESVASGESESRDAATEAGIVILPPPDDSVDGDFEVEEDTFEFDKGVVKWPKTTLLLDTFLFEVEDSWHDTPPEGFSLTLSPFATMWNALFGWITCSSLAFIYGRDESSVDDFLCVNDREYHRKIVLQGGRSSEIKQTMAGCVARTLPQLVTDLHVRTPVSSIEKAMAHLLETMSFVYALPPFKIKQWRVIVLLLVNALSVYRIPTVMPQMTSSRVLLQKVLGAAQVGWDEYESMKNIILPLGRVPQFSAQSGA